MKLFLIIALLLVASALGRAVYFLLQRRPEDPNDPQDQHRRLATALKWRLIISFTLIALLLLAYALGWIHPHAAPLQR